MELGEDWQKEYYVWDCCAGTGNLLFGLTEKYRVYASTLDNADVQVMHERIKEKSLDLLDSHVFQFDFLNDSFDRLPQSLQEIINDPEKRRKLVVYINPPYAEAVAKYREDKTVVLEPDVTLPPVISCLLYTSTSPCDGVLNRLSSFVIKK